MPKPLKLKALISGHWKIRYICFSNPIKVIEENSKNISKKKSEIGSESLEDRIESLKNQIQILETKVDDEARFSIGLAMAGSQLVDISGNLSRVMLHDSWSIEWLKAN